MKGYKSTAPNVSFLQGTVEIATNLGCVVEKI